MPTATYLLALLVIAIVASVVLLMIRHDRRQRLKKRASAARAGFTPYETGASEFEREILTLHTATSSQQLELENTFIRSEGEISYLLFDLIGTSDDVSVLQEGGLAVISARLDLPRFSIFPKLIEGGRLSEWGNRFLQALIQRRGGLVEVSHHPRFEERYFLLAADPAPVLRFLDSYRLSRLSSQAYQSIEAGGRTFTYSRFPMQTKRETAGDELELHLAQARNLYQIFQPAQPG
jgi:hypothetical protein